MVDRPRSGFGALLQRGDGASPENFVTILGVKSISGPDISRETYDTTTMDQADLYRRFVGGLVDAGEISFDANWLPRDITQSQADGGWFGEFDLDSCDSVRNWRIVTPSCPGEDGVIIDFEGVVTGASVQMPMDDLMSFSGTCKVSGRPAITIETAT